MNYFFVIFFTFHFYFHFFYVRTWNWIQIKKIIMALQIFKQNSEFIIQAANQIYEIFCIVLIC